MSQLASFTELPVRAVQFLIPAALPRRRLFRRPESKFNDYLQEHGKDLGCFGADGMGLTPLGYFCAGVLGSAVGLGNAVEACNIGK